MSPILAAPGICRIAPALGVSILLAVLPGAATAQDTGDPAACDSGWTDVERRHDIAPEAVAARSADEVWVGGGSLLGGGRRQAAVLAGDGRSWRLELPPALPERDSGFMAITTSGSDVWAVGYAREVDYVAAVAAVRADGGWRLTDTLRPGGDSATLTAVDAGGTEVWAAGYIQGPPGDQRPWVLQRRGDSWKPTETPLADGEAATLAGIAVSDDGSVWAAGTVVDQAGMRPYLVRRDGEGWLRQPVDGLDGAVLADIEMLDAAHGWAVGHRLVGSTIEPLLLHWDGESWTEAPGPVPGPGPTLLTSVAVAGEVLTVGGATWDPDPRRYLGFVARDDGSGWSLSVTRRDWGMGTVTDIDGDPGTSGWAVARTDEGIMARVCGSPDTLVSPVEDPLPAPSERVARETAAAGPIGGDVVVHDVAAAAGLPIASQSWGAVAADFDGDGLDDIFLGRHGARARLFLNDGGTFRESELRFGGGDRHGCAAADVDDSGLPDLYCSFGALRGTGVKANQLWIDPGGADPIQHPSAGGATEPIGRGRQARFLDVDEDGDDDLLVGQEAKRMDGQPSLNRVYLRTGPARFEATAAPGFDADLATESLSIADYDGDGRDDVLLIYYSQRASAPQSGIRLYRNEEGTAFSDVTSETGIETIAERDGELVDLDGDGRIDLVQLSLDRIVVSRSRDGRFERSFERGVSAGTALASGDADGDGDVDLYVLQGKTRDGGRDLILLNDGDATSFTALDVPRVDGGSEDDVIALDYDADGRTDFLALNGRNSVLGPVQLITLRPA